MAELLPLNVSTSCFVYKSQEQGLHTTLTQETIQHAALVCLWWCRSYDVARFCRHSSSCVSHARPFPSLQVVLYGAILIWTHWQWQHLFIQCLEFYTDDREREKAWREMNTKKLQKHETQSQITWCRHCSHYTVSQKNKTPNSCP